MDQRPTDAATRTAGAARMPEIQRLEERYGVPDAERASL